VAAGTLAATTGEPTDCGGACKGPAAARGNGNLT
jgi:hypothetical protein